TEERFIERYNADLANSLGNLLNRTLTMAAKYQDNRIAFPEGDRLQNPDERSTEFYPEQIARQVGAYKSHMSAGRTLPFTLPVTFGSFVVNAAIGNILEIANQGNALVENAAPWKLAKDLAKASKEKLNSVLYSLTETLRIIAILISPVLPKAAHGIFDQ